MLIDKGMCPVVEVLLTAFQIQIELAQTVGSIVLDLTGIIDAVFDLFKNCRFQIDGIRVVLDGKLIGKFSKGLYNTAAVIVKNQNVS